MRYYNLFHPLEARNDRKSQNTKKFRDGIHLGIIASVIALLDRMDIVMGQFFVISFIYYFMVRMFNIYLI